MPASVLLKPVTLAHADAIQQLATSHPDITAMTRLPDPYPDGEAAVWVLEAQREQEEGRAFHFVVVNEEDDVIGSCGLQINEKEAALDYWIGFPYWNKGYGTSAIGKALDFAFAKQRYHRLYSIALERNEPACRVLEKNGFRLKQLYQNVEPHWGPSDMVAEYVIEYGEWADRTA